MRHRALGVVALVLTAGALAPFLPAGGLRLAAPFGLAQAQTTAPGDSQPAPSRRKRGRQAKDESPPPKPATPPKAAAPVKAAAPAALPSPDVPEIEEQRGDAERRLKAFGPVQVPRNASGAVVRVPLAEPPGLRLARGELPPGWDLKRFAGRAQFELVRDDGRAVFRLASRASSFALHRDVAIDLDQFPILTWSWKVTRLPARGDARARDADDQAAQVYLVFPRSPSPRTASEVLGYVWDSRAPAGLRLTNPQRPNVRLIVLESGERRMGGWVTEQRDVREDYTALFGKAPPTLGKVALMTDSDQTRGESEAFFDELRFQRPKASPPSQPARSN